jgi:tRNA A37 methylthiotransferase MiaB
VPEKEADRRLQMVLEVQDHQTTRINQALVDSVVRVLVEGKSKKQATIERHASSIVQSGESWQPQWTGRTATNKIVNFIHPSGDGSHADFCGKMADISIKKVFLHSLWGEVVYGESKPDGLKGDKTHAA